MSKNFTADLTMAILCCSDVNSANNSVFQTGGGGGVPGYVDVGSGSTCSVSSTVTTVSDHSPDSTWGSPNKQNNDSLFAFIR